MNKQEIIIWCDKYNKEEDSYNKNAEDALRSKFQINKCFSKEDLIRVVKWKFQGRLEGRQKRIIKLLKDTDEKFILKLSKFAFSIDDDRTRIKLLCTIDGVGSALASTLLTFYDPNNYGVFDIHAWRELFGKEANSLFTNDRNVLRFFGRLRDIARENKMPCRDVEKALFKKNITQKL